MARKPTAPSHAELARLYTRLDQYQRAGVPLLQALAEEPAPHPALVAMRKRLKQGLGLAEAGRRTGLWPPFDAALIGAGEAHGEPPFGELAQIHATAVQRRARLRRKLLPALLLIGLSLLLSPLPELVGGQIGLGAYLLHALGGIALLLLLARLLLGLASDPGRHDLFLRLPGFGPLAARRARLTFVHTLGLLLKAGLSAQEALPLARATIPFPNLREPLAGAEAGAQRGESLSQLIAPLTDADPQLSALLHSGEAAGRLDATLLHHVALTLPEQEASETALLDWLARGIYLMVVLWLAAGFIGVLPGQLPPLDPS